MMSPPTTDMSSVTTKKTDTYSSAQIHSNAITWSEMICPHLDLTALTLAQILYSPLSLDTNANNKMMSRLSACKLIFTSSEYFICQLQTAHIQFM